MVLRTIPQFSIVTVLQSNSAWSQVSYNGANGYVMTKFLTFIGGSTQTASPTPTTVPTLAPSVTQSNYARVTTISGSLNMRYFANEDASVIRTIPQGAYVTVLQWGQEWSRVTYGSNTGFVMSKFLTAVSTIPTATSVPTPTKAPSYAGIADGMYAKIVTMDGSLNMRSEPRAGLNIICTIPQYEVVPVITKGSIWCQVSYNGQSGYVKTEFLAFQSTPEGSGVPTGGNSAPNGTSGNHSSSNGVTQAQYDAMKDYTLKALQTPALGQVKPGNDVSVKLYKGCSVLSTVVDIMKENEFVVIKAVGDEWCAILYESETGYCLKEKLEFETYE